MTAQRLRERVDAFDGEAETYDAAELEPRRLPDLFMGATLFATNRLVVIRGAAQNKTVWVDLEQWIERVPDETDIVLVEPSPDKRTRTYKLLQKHGTVHEHGELSDAELQNWLQTHAR